MEKPDWLPDPPDGWLGWRKGHYGDWRSERAESEHGWVDVRHDSLGPSVHAGFADGLRKGEMHRAMGHDVEALHRACAAVGLSEWLPEPWEAKLRRAMASFRDELKSMSGSELLARMEESYTGEFDALYEDHGPKLPDAPGLWLYTDGLGENCARVCLDGGTLVAQVPGVAGAVPLSELDVDWLGPIGRME